MRSSVRRASIVLDSGTTTTAERPRFPPWLFAWIQFGRACPSPNLEIESGTEDSHTYEASRPPRRTASHHEDKLWVLHVHNRKRTKARSCKLWNRAALIFGGCLARRTGCRATVSLPRFRQCGKGASFISVAFIRRLCEDGETLVASFHRSVSDGKCQSGET